jgi:abhydrolase domain-containing protein 13
MLSGTRDEVVPQKHMKALWEKAKQRHDSAAKTAEGGVESNKDQFKELQFGSHCNTCYQHGYWSAVKDFLNALNLP